MNDLKGVVRAIKRSRLKSLIQSIPNDPPVVVMRPPEGAPQKRQVVQCKTIAREVCDYYRIGPNNFYSRRRSTPFVRARQVAYYLCRQLTQCSMPEIGRILGGRDHTTILHGCRVIERLISDPQMAADIAYLTKRLTPEAEAA